MPQVIKEKMSMNYRFPKLVKLLFLSCFHVINDLNVYFFSICLFPCFRNYMDINGRCCR